MKQKLHYQITILFTLLIVTNIFAQDKIKGNKIVEAQTRDLDYFSSIEINNNINVYFLPSKQQEVKVETDENIQDYLKTEVLNGVLSISLTAKIKSSKALNVFISTTDSIQTITANDKSNLFAEMPISFKTLTLNANNNADIEMNIKSDSLTINGAKKSNLKLDLSGDKLTINLTESSKVKATITTKKMIFSGEGNTKLITNGKSNKLTIITTHNSLFDGKNFKTQEASIKAKNSSDVYIRAKDKLEITAQNTAKIYVFDKPTIKLKLFADKAILYKK